MTAPADTPTYSGMPTSSAEPTHSLADAAAGKLYGEKTQAPELVPFRFRCLVDGEPEDHQFYARPSLDIHKMRRAYGLQRLADIQQTITQTGGLPRELVEALGSVYTFVGSMLTDRDGVPASWDASPPRTGPEGQQYPAGPDYLVARPGEAMAHVRLPDGTVVDYSDSRVWDAQRLDQASSKRRWNIITSDEERLIGIEEVVELVGDLLGKAGGDRPLGESSPSSTPPITGQSGPTSTAGSPSPA
jgi:hypothetical protein